MKRLLVAMVVGVLALGLGACGSDDEDSNNDNAARNGGEEKAYTIGMANFLLGAPYFLAMSQAVEAEAETVGATVRVTDARGDAALLTSNIDDLLSQDLDGIIISGGPLEAAPAALNAIEQAGIPVVMVDRKLKGGEYSSWVGPDNEAIGRQDGEYLAERLGGEGKVAIIRGGPADNTIGLARTEGVQFMLEQEPGIEIVTAPDFGEWSSDGGLKVTENLLAKHSDLAAVFCENDSMCLGAQQAIENAGKTDDIVIAGVDGQKEALKAILDGTNYEVTGLNNADQIGRMGFQRLKDIMDGKDVEKDTVVPSPQITKENAEEHYDPDSIF
jgi:ribose transport system substrate-binding protein